MTIFIKSSLKRFNYLQKYYRVLSDDNLKKKNVLNPMLLKINVIVVLCAIKKKITLRYRVKHIKNNLCEQTTIKSLAYNSNKYKIYFWSF